MLEKWILLVDPDSNQFYTLNLTTYEIFIELNAPLQLRKKAGQTILNINQLLRFDHPYWLFESESARNYRFRKLPKYLLKKISSDYPTYICQSGLSLAFAETDSIILEINITQYHSEMVQLIKNTGVYRPEAPTCKTMVVSLLDSADEIVKKLIRELYKEYEVILKPKVAGKKFVLRIFGYREYLIGSFSLLCYDRIRLILRGGKRLQVVLTEIDKKKLQNENLLPIIERESTVLPSVEDIDWSKFLHTPIYLWYPPYKLPTYNYEKLFNEKELEESKESFDKKKYEEISRPRVLTKMYMETFITERREQIKNGIFASKNNSVFSGECDIPFKIKIIGLENIFQLLEQSNEREKDDDPHRNAIYNGLLTPSYITKATSTKSKEDHITKSPKRKMKSKEKTKRSLTPKLFKKERQSSYNPKTIQNVEKLFTRHTHHGFQGASKFSLISKKYELNLIPYLIQINAYLYLGSKLLSPTSFSQTIQLPFSHSPKFNFWLQFGDIRISQLPLESRISFDILMYSSTGESQIIASTNFQIFDVSGNFKSGVKSLNLWPFYRHEARLVCSGEFWGIRETFEGQEKIASEFARLVVETQKFENDMVWTIRDNETMKIMGFPSLNEIIEEKTEEEFNLMDNVKKVVDKIGFKKLKNALKKYDTLESEGEEVYEPKIKNIDWHATPSNEDLTKLQNLLNLNPLCRNKLTDDEKYILKKCRNHYKTLSKAFPIFLSAIDWNDPDQVAEVHRILKTWTPLSPQEALPLLDAPMADEIVRLYAVKQISSLSDDELALYMLELIQVLMFECHHCSPLSEFLLERALDSPFMVGTALFWNLRSQLHLKPSYERFSLILENLLFLSGPFREELMSDVKINDGLMKIAEDIKRMDKNVREGELKSQLKKFKTIFPESFCLAIDSRWEVEDFILEKCSVMNSKKLPLWLVCSNSQKAAPPLKMLFKCGDDLRQDQLAMQLIQIMDRIWLDNGYDFRMKPYRVLATYDQVGMLEVVLNAETTSSIHLKFGGAFGALKEDTILRYLKEHNKDTESEKNALDNFVKSCAGYCVATYILGIGDRHSGNIMVTTSGNLFHIDFGHFLGNFKYKYGFKRERSPFVLTEEMAHVMGGKTGKAFKTFEEYCVRGYNLVRKNGNFLISIFMMMLSAGMPELGCLEDLEYLSKQLSLDLSEAEANIKFKKEINDCLKSTWRKYDNLFHSMKRN